MILTDDKMIRMDANGEVVGCQSESVSLGAEIKEKSVGRAHFLFRSIQMKLMGGILLVKH